MAKLAKARDCNGFVILRSGVRLTPGRRFFVKGFYSYFEKTYYSIETLSAPVSGIV